jgi:peroxiredoxin
MTMLEIGAAMPAFELQDDTDATVRARDLKGRKTVIFVYPKASTPG